MVRKSESDEATAGRSEKTLIRAGEIIDAARCADIKEDYLRLAGEAGDSLTIDLGGTKGIEPSGLALLLALRNSFVRAGGREVELINLSGEIMRLADGLSLGKYFKITR